MKERDSRRLSLVLAFKTVTHTTALPQNIFFNQQHSSMASAASLSPFARAIVTSTFVLFAVVVLLLAPSATAAAAASKGPQGTYCGSYSFGLVTGKVVFNAATFDIAFDGLGAHVKCGGESYTVDAASGVLAVPGASDPTNCLGSVLHDNGLSLDATYHAAKDSIDLDLGLASLTVTRC